MRKQLDAQLNEIDHELMLMGGLVEDLIKSDLEALKRHDHAQAQELKQHDYNLGHRARNIENLCMDILLRQQPVASDLRYVSSVLKMISDIERIGHQACDIADIVANFDPSYYGPDLLLLGNMAEEAANMVHECIDSYVARDPGAARQVIAHDNVVDRQFFELKQALIAAAAVPGNDFGISLDVLMMAKYLERIGDHACNVAKWVNYAIVGSHDGN